MIHVAGQRQPTNLVIAKGRKHFTKEEVERRLSREPRVSFTSIEAPEYLPKNLESKFYDYAYKLLDIGIMTELDEDCLANYLISHNLYLQYTNKISQAMRAGDLDKAADYTKVQDRYFKQMRACATDLGLTISSRCKLVVPEKDEQPKENKFAKFGTKAASGR